MGLIERIFKPAVSRRRFLQATATSGAAATLVGGYTLRESQAQAPAASRTETKITKNICHQCPARCGIDVYTTDGRVHAIYGNTDHPIANGKLCPKGPLGTYILYDPDRFKGPMKRTNPKKGRNEDPKFVPISWDEALNTVAARLQGLRDKGESHRFALAYGRGWGASCAGHLGTFGKLYGSPNVPIGHSSMCSDGSIKSKQATDGNGSYNAHDYRNCNYLMLFGVGFLEAFRPYNNVMQMWGYMRGEKSPKTRVTAVDVHMNTTLAASDRALLIKPGTDGALALAMAHEILVGGLWERSFVGDFKDGVNLFKAGQTVDPASFSEKWVKGLVEWWNVELKDRTPKWASEITTILERDIVATAREFGSTRPAMAIFERGVHAHSNGIYNGMAVHSLNALVGSLFAKGDDPARAFSRQELLHQRVALDRDDGGARTVSHWRGRTHGSRAAALALFGIRGQPRRRRHRCTAYGEHRHRADARYRPSAQRGIAHQLPPPVLDARPDGHPAHRGWLQPV